jgi:hypothetical protein
MTSILTNKARRDISELRGEGFAFTGKAVGEMAGHREFGIYASAYAVATYIARRHHLAFGRSLEYLIDEELTDSLTHKYKINFGHIEPAYPPNVRADWNAALAEYIDDILHCRRDNYPGAGRAVAAAIRKVGPLRLNVAKYRKHVIAELDYERMYAAHDRARNRGVKLSWNHTVQVLAVVRCEMSLDELLAQVTTSG